MVSYELDSRHSRSAVIYQMVNNFVCQDNTEIALCKFHRWSSLVIWCRLNCALTQKRKQNSKEKKKERDEQKKGQSNAGIGLILKQIPQNTI